MAHVGLALLTGLLCLAVDTRPTATPRRKAGALRRASARRALVRHERRHGFAGDQLPEGGQEALRHQQRPAWRPEHRGGAPRCGRHRVRASRAAARRWRWRERARAASRRRGERRADDRAIVIKHVGQRPRCAKRRTCPARRRARQASGVRLRAGTLSAVDGHQHFADPDRRAGRDAHGARFILRRAVGVPASTRGAPLAHLAQSGGQGARTEQPVALGGGEGGRRAGQPAGGGRRRAECWEGSWLRIMQEPRARTRRDAAGRAAAGLGAYNGGHGKVRISSSCPSVGSVRAARPMVISSAAGSASTAWWCPNWAPARFPTRSSRWNAPRRLPDLARHDTDQQAGGLCVRQAEKGYTPAVALIDAFALRRRPRAAALRARPSGRPGRGRPAGHRFPGPAGADAGRSHRQAADRRGFRGRQRIPGARAGQPVGSRPRTVESRPVAGRQALRPSRCAGRTATSCASCCARARSVRSAVCASWSASGGGPEARAHRPRGAGRPAAGAVALSAREDERWLPRPGPGAARPYPHRFFSLFPARRHFMKAALSFIGPLPRRSIRNSMKIRVLAGRSLVSVTA